MSETETAKYSVFWDDGWQPNNGSFAGLSLNEFIARCAEEFGPPVAWAAEWTFVYEGHKTHKQLHAESIAAGRLIDCIDGKYIARGLDSDAEMLALQTRPQHEPASCEEGYVNSHDHTLKFTTEGEKVRPPLPGYGQRTPFNNFDGFTVTSDCAYESQPNTSFAGLMLDGCGAFVLPKQAF